ncbi:endonuclease domain-containing protein [Corynebacterium coyleae]
MRIPESDVYCIHRTDCIGADRKIQVTSPERTAIDIARFHGVRQGAVAMDWLLSFGTLQEKRRRWETIQAKIARLKGKRGIANARRALELASPWSESPYETLLRVILHENGIEVEMQLWIGPDFRVDLIWGNLVIEIDGLDKFENKPHDAVLSQLKRETWIREQGYEVIRFFTREILRNPEECVRRIREAKARADKRGEPQVAATRQRPRQRQSRFP